MTYQQNVFDALKSGKSFVFIDGKADVEQWPHMQRAVCRHDLTKEECKRRGVRFLPAQVMRPIFAANNLL